MQPVNVDEIRTLPEYEKVREEMRRRVIALKKHRRVHVGDSISMVFENRETVLWQIHEMVRTEGLSKPEAVAHECATYSELLPGDGQLSATLFIELPPGADIRRGLDELVGIDEKTALVIGDEVIPAEFDPGQVGEDRISSVHYVKFTLSPEQRELFRDRSVAASVRIDHPRYRASVELVGETRRSLASDLE
jgi:hypothetical protein